jgi:hypothetical protein
VHDSIYGTKVFRYVQNARDVLSVRYVGTNSADACAWPSAQRFRSAVEFWLASGADYHGATATDDFLRAGVADAHAATRDDHRLSR